MKDKPTLTPEELDEITGGRVTYGLPGSKYRVGDFVKYQGITAIGTDIIYLKGGSFGYKLQPVGKDFGKKMNHIAPESELSK